MTVELTTEQREKTMYRPSIPLCDSASTLARTMARFDSHLPRACDQLRLESEAHGYIDDAETT
jgi:hypothetical protein